MTVQQNKIVITTGDDVTGVVWTQEKLEELQSVIDKIKMEEQENVRASFELSGIKVTDSQYEQIQNAAKYFEDNTYDSLQE